MDQTWKPIPGFENYEVSDKGRVRERSGTELTIKVHSSGYRMVTLLGPNGRVTRRLHHLVLEAFVEKRPEGLIGLHYDDDPANNHLSNLRWGTQSDNRHDSVRNGTHRQTAKKVCPGGHRLEMPNLVAHRLRKGHRECLACQRGWQAVYDARRRGEHLDIEAVSDAKYEAIMDVPAVLTPYGVRLETAA